MNETKILQPIAEMLLAIERQDSPLWPLSVIYDLESRSTGKAMDWACAFIESQLIRFGSPNTITMRQDWLSDLRELTTALPSFESAARTSREVWYADETRDEAQTAIARLYEALSSLSKEDHIAYCKAVAMAVMVLATDACGRPLPAAIAKMVDLYKNMANELKGT